MSTCVHLGAQADLWARSQSNVYIKSAGELLENEIAGPCFQGIWCAGCGVELTVVPMEVNHSSYLRVCQYI